MEQKCANCGNGKWRDGVTAITDICIECKYVDKNGKPQPSNWKPKVLSNADRIRAMTDEELAHFLAWHWNKKDYGLEWLKQPAEE